MTNVTLQNYPDLRDLTRSISEDIQSRITTYIEAVSHLFRPSPVFGPYVTTPSKTPSSENPKTASSSFAQYRTLHKEVANAAPFGLDVNLPDVVVVNSAMPVISPLTYQHSMTTPAGARRLIVTIPFRFVISFPAYPFPDLRPLIAARSPKDKLAEYVLHYTVLNYVVMQNKKLLRLFEDLRFPIQTERLDEFGALPLTVISSPSGTVRPSDQLISQLIRFSGADTAEELADVESWAQFPDPLADRFRAEAAKFSVEIGPAS
jgi:hypothetical protein